MSKHPFAVGKPVTLVEGRPDSLVARPGVVSKVGRKYLYAAPLATIESHYWHENPAETNPTAWPFLQFSLHDRSLVGSSPGYTTEVWDPEEWEAESASQAQARNITGRP
ncbi:hypothetical protein Bequi_13885 [Brachybacterium sp. JHP9]|uniref:Nitrile hydratase beta subunit domain-containing protein n=1 Tax=Brachybacterium equifaecis TaxID=2910770 RepID=A0ABT0R3D6_9MICO|nr:hypothetical protein [Brachybacterium equifaecis]MCL6424456.1 hypothetical protein [Brachybacterium equifaecis]